MTTLRPNSKITEVTVFESSAQIRRVATIDTMARGEVNVVFSDLPQNLDRENVQVAVRFEKQTDAASEKEQPSCSLRGVSFKTESVTKDISADRQAERDAQKEKVENLKRQIQEAQDELSEVLAQAAFFKGCSNSALNGTRPEEDNDKVFSDTETWKKMFDTVADQDATALAQQRTLERKIRELQAEQHVAQIMLNSFGGVVTNHHNVVIVTLVASRPLTDVDVRISYVVNAAKWTAEYDVRYDPEKNEAKVTYNAVVSQWGTEIWKDAILTISTARPTISGRPKDLTPWHAKIYEPVVYKSYRESKSKSFFGGAPGGAACSAPSLQMERAEECLSDQAAIINIENRLQALVAPTIETAKVKAGATAMSFVIDSHPYTVLNNNKEVRVTLAIVPVKSTVTYLTRPKLTETVFARMKAVNLSDFTLLPGPALVFCGQTFISKTTLERCGPSDDFSVNLGADNDVTVKYKRIKNERGESGGGLMSSKKIKYTIQTKIIVKNRKRDKIEITVEDQIPISQHGDIEVTMVQPPPPTDDEKDKERKEKLRSGTVDFVLTIPGGQEKEIPIEFVVKHPEGFDMEGL